MQHIDPPIAVSSPFHQRQAFQYIRAQAGRSTVAGKHCLRLSKGWGLKVTSVHCYSVCELPQARDP